VSVVIPSYNVKPFLADAVRSVLRQTWTQLETIVVDDGSTDGTGQLAEQLAASDPRVRVIHKRNGGVSSARNAGAAVAQGEYVSFLDADDMLLPEKLERQLAVFDLFPSCDLVFSDHYVGDSRLTPLHLECSCPPSMPLQEVLLYRNWFAPMSPLMRSEFQKRIGPFDENLTGSEDWDYWLRASWCGVLVYLPGPVAVYRTHPGQTHRHLEHMQTNMERVVRKHFVAGSRPWRVARAARSWFHAKQLRGQGRYAAMISEYLGSLWYARSARTLVNMIRLGV
jgi:glycosyltransferase involved in cell wall biosynthesis